MTWEEIERGVAIEDFRIDNVPARVAEARRSLEAAARRARALRAGERAVSLPIRAHYAADGGAAGRRAPGRRRVAVRAEVGRLPLPRVPRRRRGRAAVEGRAAARPLLPRDRRGARARSTAKRFVLDGEIVIPVGGRLVVRRAAAAHPSRGEPRRASSRRSIPAHATSSSTCSWTSAGDRSCDEPLARAPRARSRRSRRSISRGASAVRLSPATTAERTAQRWFASVGGGARRRDREAARSAVPVRRAHGHAEDQADAHRRLRGRRLPLRRRRATIVGSLLLGLYDDEGLLDHVGFMLRDPDRRARATLTPKARGAASSRPASPAAPGGPSRWSTERSRRVGAARARSWWSRWNTTTSPAAASATAPSFLRWRPDKAPAQCTMEQVEHESRSPLRLYRVNSAQQYEQAR